MKVLDLFSGAGGLSSGFHKVGFQVTGADNSEIAGTTYKLNGIGKFVDVDLSKDTVDGDYEIILGGPPCRPWAAVNTVRRGSKHPDYGLLSKFFDHVRQIDPVVFMMENVPALGNKLILKRKITAMKNLGYSVSTQTVIYSEFGAPTIRRRLVVFGTKKGDATDFFKALSNLKRNPRTVKDVIWHLRHKSEGESSDHEWPDFKTINNYKKYYTSNKYGWYVLDWGKPSPSFGNIMKTYILHPDSFNGGLTRVLSVREAFLIMGFQRGFRLPKGSGMGARYQMAADAVSPSFSGVAAKAVKQFIEDGVNNGKKS